MVRVRIWVMVTGKGEVLGLRLGVMEQGVGVGVK
jgi:hypothetical protein